MECCQFKISHLRSSTLTRSLSAAAMQSITCCQQFERGQEEGISDERKTECTTDLLDTRARTHTHTNRCPRISFSCHARTKCTGNHLLLYNLFTHSGIPLALSPPPPPPLLSSPCSSHWIGVRDKEKCKDADFGWQAGQVEKEMPTQRSVAKLRKAEAAYPCAWGGASTSLMVAAMARRSS